MRYELTDLRVFKAIADSGNLSVAAAGLFLSPSSTSYRLKNLEHALGAPLFERIATGMKLTPAGEVLLEHVSVILGSVEVMDSDVSRFSSGLRGRIKLAANSSSMHGYLVPVLGRFLIAYPGINIEMVERQSEMIPSAIATSEFEVGVMAGSVESSVVRTHSYVTDELILVAPVGHELAQRGLVSFEEALDHEFVCLSRSSSNFAFLSDSAQKLGRRVPARLHVPSFEAVLALVADGIGVSLVPRSVVRTSANRGRLEVVRLRESWASRQLSIVTLKDGNVPGYVESFVSFLLNDRKTEAGL
ncbi:LysR family transcriptional regulator [Rhodococcus sp. KBW08]|uniref:LysR family transcriptional regulator n=1 Tax=Rhodococcus sp. KBW08 TaxID=2144188 RepID=UPI000F5A81A5|nr:LysR family transcriptional regulator [Rhodococcus sp. KBW08]RQO46104.1 LysR family transcriptional regulator [Rhodococcus sp. KBW08]